MLKIIYIDDDIIVIDKPAPLPTLSSPKGFAESLARMLIQKYDELGMIEPIGEAGLIQRLDNETSGLIIAAKNQPSHDALSKASKGGEIKKVYLAVVHGFTSQRDAIDIPIAHHHRKKDRMTVCSSAAEKSKLKGREARTEFNALSYYMDEDDPAKNYTLLRVMMRKGARHQIRVHLASIGHPIVGDKIYKNKRYRTNSLELQRHFLHSHGVCFRHPVSKEELCFISTLPAVLMKFLSSLKKVKNPLQLLP